MNSKTVINNFSGMTRQAFREKRPSKPNESLPTPSPASSFGSDVL